MFGTNMETPNRMLSYDSALNKWASIKPIRGRSDQNTRPLARRTNDNLTIRRLDDDSIAVRLYNTDIIRYDTNNLIHLEPYPSALTNRVMSSILAPHVFTHWTNRWKAPGLITEVGGRYYHTPSFATIQPKETGWVLVDGAKPVEVPYLNRKEGKQALRDANYYTFKVWLETKIRLGIAEFGHRWGSSPFGWTPALAVHFLRQGETGWVEISGRMSNSTPIEEELRSLREAVYQYECCYHTKTVEYFTSYNEYKNAIHQMQRIG